MHITPFGPLGSRTKWLMTLVVSRKRAKHIVIDGSVPPQKRQGLVNDFQNDTRVKVALLSIQAAGVGLTLTVSFDFHHNYCENASH